MSARETLGVIRDVIAAIEELHAPFNIYDECDCTDADLTLGDHVDVCGIGLTCNRTGTVCASCCTGADGNQTEECAAYHEHRAFLPICPTRAILDGAE